MDVFLDALWLFAEVLGVVVLPVFVVWYVANCFTFVEESTAKAVIRFGGLKKMLFAKNGWQLDKDDELVEVKGYKHPFGGLRFVGLLKPLGFDKIYTYTFDWVKVMPDKEGSYVLEQRHEENVDYILVDQIYVYGLNIRGKEVVDKDLVPVEVSLALPAKIVGPRKALFDTTDWFNTFISLIDPAVRNYVNTKSYREIITLSGNDLGKDVMKRLVKLGIAGENGKLETLYGIRLMAIECKGIKLEGEYQDEQTEKWKAEQDAEADKKRQEIESDAFANETALTELKMLATSVGVTAKDLQTQLKKSMKAAIKADPVNGLQKWMESQKKYWTLVQQKQLGVKPILFGNADGSSMDPLTATLASLISLAKGGSSSSGTGGAATPPPPWRKNP